MRAWWVGGRERTRSPPLGSLGILVSSLFRNAENGRWEAKMTWRDKIDRMEGLGMVVMIPQEDSASLPNVVERQIKFEESFVSFLPAQFLSSFYQREIYPTKPAVSDSNFPSRRPRSCTSSS
jgi:hypothetical protein